MKRIIKLVLCFLLIRCLIPYTIFGCTQAYIIPPKFDTSDYIFIGKVIDIVGPIEIDNNEKAWGVLVRINEKVYLPQTPKANFEVYPFNTYADCSPAGVKHDELSNKFPVGSVVRIVAKKAKHIKDVSNNGNIRLETEISNGGSIALNDLDERLITSSKSACNYRKYYRDHKELMEASNNIFKSDPLTISHNELLDFELRKDLYKLYKADSEEAKVKILERLIYYPGHYNFSKIVEMHINNNAVVKKVINKRAIFVNRSQNDFLF
jgi:hypothetical protein